MTDPSPSRSTVATAGQVELWAEDLARQRAILEELRRRGYELRNVIIWDRTNVVNKVGIFGWPSNYITMGVTFEYLLDFWRPA